MPSRPCPRRLQKDAFIVPRCAGSPGVPASTSRNGASTRTLWPALSSVLPTSGSSVCASSSRAATAFLRHRARSFRARSSGASAADVAHSTEPAAATPTFRGRSFDVQVRGDSAAARAARLGISSGVRATASNSRSSQACLNQLSSTVLPLPRGPVSTTSCGGDAPPDRSSRHRLNTACSGSRPVSAGGVAPDPGVNRRCLARSMTESICKADAPATLADDGAMPALVRARTGQACGPCPADRRWFLRISGSGGRC